MEAMNRKLAVLVCAAAICLGSVASAQENPEMGDTGQAAPAWAPPSGGAEASASASASTETGVDASGDSSSDSAPSSSPSGTGAHADVVGKFGIGFFGLTAVPICDGDLPGACGVGTTDVPSIGLRYWLNEGMAIEAGLGFAMHSGTREITLGGGSAEALDNSTTAFLLHGAVPLALAYSGNFVFQVVPELNLGFATGTAYGATAAEDVDLSGLLLQLGARAGAEIHFGFIGLPQLSLQGSVGLHLSYRSRSGSRGADEGSYSTTDINTSVGNNPWDIFAGNITAIYYFID